MTKNKKIINVREQYYKFYLNFVTLQQNRNANYA